MKNVCKTVLLTVVYFLVAVMVIWATMLLNPNYYEIPVNRDFLPTHEPLYGDIRVGEVHNACQVRWQTLWLWIDKFGLEKTLRYFPHRVGYDPEADMWIVLGYIPGLGEAIGTIITSEGDVLSIWDINGE